MLGFLLGVFVGGSKIKEEFVTAGNASESKRIAKDFGSRVYSIGSDKYYFNANGKGVPCEVYKNVFGEEVAFCKDPNQTPGFNKSNYIKLKYIPEFLGPTYDHQSYGDAYYDKDATHYSPYIATDYALSIIIDKKTGNRMIKCGGSTYDSRSEYFVGSFLIDVENGKYIRIADNYEKRDIKVDVRKYDIMETVFFEKTGYHLWMIGCPLTRSEKNDLYSWEDWLYGSDNKNKGEYRYFRGPSTHKNKKIMGECRTPFYGISLKKEKDVDYDEFARKCAEMYDENFNVKKSLRWAVRENPIGDSYDPVVYAHKKGYVFDTDKYLSTRKEAQDE